ncbi:MAG: hypothetical protein ACRDID_10640 [Ktedonobacterales bacterium]
MPVWNPDWLLLSGQPSATAPARVNGRSWSLCALYHTTGATTITGVTDEPRVLTAMGLLRRALTFPMIYACPTTRPNSARWRGPRSRATRHARDLLSGAIHTLADQTRRLEAPAGGAVIVAQEG